MGATTVHWPLLALPLYSHLSHTPMSMYRKTLVLTITAEKILDAALVVKQTLSCLMSCKL